MSVSTWYQRIRLLHWCVALCFEDGDILIYREIHTNTRSQRLYYNGTFWSGLQHLTVCHTLNEIRIVRNKQNPIHTHTNTHISTWKSSIQYTRVRIIQKFQERDREREWEEGVNVHLCNSSNSLSALLWIIRTIHQLVGTFNTRWPSLQIISTVHLEPFFVVVLGSFTSVDWKCTGSSRTDIRLSSRRKRRSDGGMVGMSLFIML